jgi:hypothetical protein
MGPITRFAQLLQHLRVLLGTRRGASLRPETSAALSDIKRYRIPLFWRAVCAMTMLR